MGGVDKALWLIETHLHGSLTLAVLAQTAGVTPFHVPRSVAVLTHAAEALVATPPAR